jgi:hypothetical protein
LVHGGVEHHRARLLELAGGAALVRALSLAPEGGVRPNAVWQSHHVNQHPFNATPAQHKANT